MAWDDPDHRAKLERERYWRNPEYRLRTINRVRLWNGYEPRASIDEVAPPRGKRVDA